MTTRVLVTNFGPGEVVAKRPGQVDDRIYPSQYKEYYVWDGQTVTIEEKKPVPPES